MESEVVTRRLRYGANSTESRGSRPLAVLLVFLFLTIVIGFLMTAAILNSAITDSVEAFSILAITLPGAIVGFAYLLKSARALDRMADATRTNACVKRGGQETEIKAEELVPGDIILLRAGEYVPADCQRPGGPAVGLSPPPAWSDGPGLPSPLDSGARCCWESTWPGVFCGPGEINPATCAVVPSP